MWCWVQPPAALSTEFDHAEDFNLLGSIVITSANINPNVSLLEPVGDNQSWIICLIFRKERAFHLQLAKCVALFYPESHLSVSYGVFQEKKTDHVRFELIQIEWKSIDEHKWIFSIHIHRHVHPLEFDSNGQHFIHEIETPRQLVEDIFTETGKKKTNKQKKKQKQKRDRGKKKKNSKWGRV